MTRRVCVRAAALAGTGDNSITTPEQAQATSELAGLPLVPLPSFTSIDGACWVALRDVVLPDTNTCYVVPTTTAVPGRGLRWQRREVTMERLDLTGANEDDIDRYWNAAFDQLTDVPAGALVRRATHHTVEAEVTYVPVDNSTQHTWVVISGCGYAVETPFDSRKDALVEMVNYGDARYQLLEVVGTHEMRRVIGHRDTVFGFDVDPAPDQPRATGWVLVADIDN